jgi:hypothetical protein
MATIQITIGPNGASPRSAPVSHTDKVEFILSDRPSATLTFDGTSPLATELNGQMINPDSITLNSSLAVEDFGILPSALKKKYPYTFPIYGKPDKEQPTTAGELEVTTDPEW